MLDFAIDHLVKEKNGQIDVYVKVFKAGTSDKILKTYCIAYTDAVSFKDKLKLKTRQVKKDVEELDLREIEINKALSELKNEVEK